jgi:hypothetical protein
MNRLENDVTLAAKKLAAKHGRCAFVLVVEPDGVNPQGVNYGLHCKAAEETSPVAYLLMQELNKHYINILHHFLGK